MIYGCGCACTARFSCLPRFTVYYRHISRATTTLVLTPRGKGKGDHGCQRGKGTVVVSVAYAGLVPVPVSRYMRAVHVERCLGPRANACQGTMGGKGAYAGTCLTLAYRCTSRGESNYGYATGPHMVTNKVEEEVLYRAAEPRYV
jgi:hypothetical protein